MSLFVKFCVSFYDFAYIDTNDSCDMTKFKVYCSDYHLRNKFTLTILVKRTNLFQTVFVLSF